MQVSIKKVFLIALLTMSVSCGKSGEQTIKDNILSANIYLSQKECQKAINILEETGRQNLNASYLKALASAYACRAGYSTTKFFGSDVELTASPGPMGGMTRYSTSIVPVTAPLTDDEVYKDLQTAINILLYAGGIPDTKEPTSAERAKYFTANEAADINSQLVFMLMVQMGKMMKVYADADASGAKGGGTATNNCFTDYSNITDPAVELILANQAGACKVKTSPHAQLDSSLVDETERRKRLCEGVVILNGVWDILPAVIESAGGGDLADIGSVTEEMANGRAALEIAYPPIATVLAAVNQSNCEASSLITTETLESYYAVLFEGLIK